MIPSVSFREATAEPRVRSLPLAHLSIELGHLYFEDFEAGPDFLQAHFAWVAPWVETARATLAASLAGPARVSTCFLVDDYFGANRPPAELIPELVAAARSAGLQLDYLARESGCAEAGRISPARVVEERIVADPPPGTNGLRPPTQETGWLCNGQRSPVPTNLQAMTTDVAAWSPPSQNAARRHSVFVDVELWSDKDGSRTWSCAYLATVWQLLRLGLLRHRGEPVVVPERWHDHLPDRWEQLPAVIQCSEKPAPFTAYRTMSVLDSRFFATELAVRTILSQVSIEAAVAQQVRDRGAGEGLQLPAEPVDRIQYAFPATLATPASP